MKKDLDVLPNLFYAGFHFYVLKVRLSVMALGIFGFLRLGILLSRFLSRVLLLGLTFEIFI